jgi:hypothetical protein
MIAISECRSAFVLKDKTQAASSRNLYQKHTTTNAGCAAARFGMD